MKLKSRKPFEKALLISVIAALLFNINHNLLYKDSNVHLYGPESLTSYIKMISPNTSYVSNLSFYLDSAQDIQSSLSTKEMKLNFVNQIMTLIHANTFHCKVYQHQNMVHLIAKYISPSIFNPYGLLDWRYMRCGFCHQRNLLLVRLLNKFGFSAKLRGLEGHVIAEIAINDEQYFADADYGVATFMKPMENEIDQQIRELYSSALSSKVNITPILKAYNDYSNDQYYNLESLEVYERAQTKILDVLGILLSMLLLTLQLSVIWSIMRISKLLRREKSFNFRYKSGDVGF